MYPLNKDTKKKHGQQRDTLQMTQQKWALVTLSFVMITKQNVKEKLLIEYTSDATSILSINVRIDQH